MSYHALFYLAFFITSLAFSRQPAVLPGYGISIEKSNKNLPTSKSFSGYEFKNTPTENPNVVQSNLARLSKTGPQSISIYLTIFALLLPFGLWFLNNKSLKEENDLINQQQEETKNLDEGSENVVEVNFPKTENDSAEDDEQKKAS